MVCQSTPNPNIKAGIPKARTTGNRGSCWWGIVHGGIFFVVGVIQASANAFSVNLSSTINQGTGGRISRFANCDFFFKSFPKRRRASGWSTRSPCESVRLVAGVRFELTTFGLCAGTNTHGPLILCDLALVLWFRLLSQVFPTKRARHSVACPVQ